MCQTLLTDGNNATQVRSVNYTGKVDLQIR